MKRWNRGDEIVLRYRRNQPADSIFPVRVIENTPKCLQVFLVDGTVYKGQATRDGRPLGREIPFLERERLIHGLCDKTWFGNHALMLQQPEAAHAVGLFWDAANWAFVGYYVNFQAPLARTSVGFDTADFLLDIVVAPDPTWHWKDRDEFDEALEHGLIGDGTAAMAQEAAMQAIADIASCGWPFNGSLVDWRPDPNWPVPMMPANWNEGF